MAVGAVKCGSAVFYLYFGLGRDAVEMASLGGGTSSGSGFAEIGEPAGGLGGFGGFGVGEVDLAFRFRAEVHSVNNMSECRELGGLGWHHERQ